MKLLLLLACAPVFAQQRAFPLESIQIAGQARIPAEKIIAVSGLKIGQPVVKSDFDQARARLLATGAFESVGYVYKPSADSKGYDATLEIVEAVQLFPYGFEDLPAPAAELRAALRKQEPILGDEIPVNNAVLDRYIAVVQRIVGDKVKVTAKLVNEPATGETIVFRPNTPRPQIAEVKFAGNRVLPSAELMRALSEVAVGTGYSETSFRQMLDASVRPLYESRGRIRVSFPKIATENSMMADGVAVITTVDEGPSYSLGSVKLEGIAAQDSGELLRAANIQLNDVANFDEVNAGIDRVLARLRDRGYLKASARLDRAIDDKSRRVDVTAAIDAGARYTMGKLEIAGLDIASEPAIRKMWNLKTGAPFQPAYPDSFLNGIRAQDLFDNLGKTKADTKIDEKSHTVDVKLTFSSAAPLR